MTADTRRAVPVSDRPAELWIKVLALSAAVIIPLFSGIGVLFIMNQEKTYTAINKTNDALDSINDKLNTYNAQIQTHSSQIMTIKQDVRDISSRVYTLEGLMK